MKLTVHIHLVPRLKTRDPIPVLLHKYVFEVQHVILNNFAQGVPSSLIASGFLIENLI